MMIARASTVPTVLESLVDDFNIFTNEVTAVRVETALQFSDLNSFVFCGQLQLLKTVFQCGIPEL